MRRPPLQPPPSPALSSALLVLALLLAPLEARLVYTGAFRRGAPPVQPAALAAALPPRARVVELRAGDGVRLLAAELPAGGGGAADAPWLLHLHGQGGAVPDYLPVTAGLAARGFNVLSLEYRGYAGAPGRPSEAALVADAGVALEHLAARGVPPGRVAVYGYSLGSGVAAAAARARPPGALVLEAPFASVPAIARARFGVPARWLRTRFDTLAAAPELRSPTLVLHAADDRLVPAAQVAAVYAALPGVKRRLALRGGHAALLGNDVAARARALDKVAAFVHAQLEPPAER